MSLGTGDMYRVDTHLGGPFVTGGGIQQFYFDLAGGTMAQACNAVKNFWNSLTSYIGTGTTMDVQATVAQVDPVDGDIIAMGAGTAYSVAGLGGTAMISLASQGLLRLRTGVYSDGREVRGRVFIPAASEVHSDAGAPIAGYVTAVNTAGAALVADANSTLVVYRRERQAADQLGAPGIPGYRPGHTHRDGGWAPVTVTDCWTKWAVLRSRRD